MKSKLNKEQKEWWNKGFLTGLLFGMVMGAGWMLWAIKGVK